MCAEEPAHIHEIDVVAARVAEGVEGGRPPTVAAALAVLPPLFEQTRYPSSSVDEPLPPDAVTEEDAREALSAARELQSWVKALLQQPAGRPLRGKPKSERHS